LVVNSEQKMKGYLVREDMIILKSILGKQHILWRELKLLGTESTRKIDFINDNVTNHKKLDNEN